MRRCHLQPAIDNGDWKQPLTVCLVHHMSFHCFNVTYKNRFLGIHVRITWCDIIDQLNHATLPIQLFNIMYILCPVNCKTALNSKKEVPRQKHLPHWCAQFYQVMTTPQVCHKVVQACTCSNLVLPCTNISCTKHFWATKGSYCSSYLVSKTWNT